MKKMSHQLFQFFPIWTIPFCLIFTSVYSADWSGWRGANGNGVLTDDDKGSYPSKWSNKDVRWKARIPGYGTSSPVVAGNYVFVTSNLKNSKDVLHVVCIDRATGTVLWDKEYWGGGSTKSHSDIGMSAPTPVTDEQHLYTLFGTGDVFCHDFLGNLVWARSIVRDYGQFNNSQGMVSSPVLYKNLLIILVPQEGEEKSYILALDNSSGDTVYKKEYDGIPSRSTPLLYDVEGRTQLIISSQKLSAYDPSTGKHLWSSNVDSSNSSPVAVGNKVINIVKNRGNIAIRLRGQDEIAKTQVAWFSSKGVANVSSGIIGGKYYYTINENGLLTCLDANKGDLFYERKIEGRFSASPVIAKKKIYLVSETGETTVVKVASNYRQLGNTPSLGDHFVASPALSDGQIFLRGNKTLVCIGRRK